MFGPSVLGVSHPKAWQGIPPEFILLSITSLGLHYSLLRLWNVYDICLCVSVGNTLIRSNKCIDDHYLVGSMTACVYRFTYTFSHFWITKIPPKHTGGQPPGLPRLPYVFFGTKGVVAAISTFCACSVVRPYLEIAGKHSLKLTAVRTLKIGRLPTRKL